MNYSVNLTLDYTIKIFLSNPSLKKLLQPISIKDIPNRDIKKEFRIIRMIYNEIDQDSLLVKNKEVMEKNRYIDILAFKHNLVKLDDKPLSKNNYINANIIHDPIEEKMLNYAILTQGPLKNTMDDFWKMVERTKAHVVIGIVEKDFLGEKCEIYWTLNKNVQIGDFSLKMNSKERLVSDLYITTDIKVTNTKTKNSFMVTHYYFYN